MCVKLSMGMPVDLPHINCSSEVAIKIKNVNKGECVYTSEYPIKLKLLRSWRLISILDTAQDI